MKTAFFVCLSIVLYTYVGYAVILYIASALQRFLLNKKKAVLVVQVPSITLIVAAYNEESCIEEKILNCLSLDYPENKCDIIIVTDGSDDNTPVIVQKYPQVTLLHKQERQGKINAIHNAMQYVQSELVLFTDANTLLNSDALLQMSRPFSDNKIGAVAGEKRIRTTAASGAEAVEGWYWKYESAIKKNEAALYSVMGAAGELFCLRTALYKPIPADTLLDDFMISTNILLMGYRLEYEPDAYATEKASPGIGEEWKRKTRIAAGGMQMLLRSGKLFASGNVLLVFEYISHRVLRWAVAPWLLFVTLALNFACVLYGETNNLVFLLLYTQLTWYAVAAIGWLLQSIGMKAGILFAPFYFCMMNAAMITGTLRFIFRGQTVFWEKAEREKH